MLGAIWDTPYNIVYLGHIVTVILGAGMAFVAPVMAARARRDAGRAVQEFVQETANALIFPSLLLAGVFGGALVGMSSDVYDFGQTWLAIAGALWMIILAIAAAVYPPSWLRVVNLGEDRRRMLAGVMHLALAIMLVVMTWKFGV